MWRGSEHSVNRKTLRVNKRSSSMATLAKYDALLGVVWMMNTVRNQAMGMRAFDETSALRPELEELQRAVADRQRAYDALLATERQHIVAHVSSQVGALLADRGYTMVSETTTYTVWTHQATLEANEPPRGVAVFPPSTDGSRQNVQINISGDAPVTYAEQLLLIHRAFTPVAPTPPPEALDEPSAPSLEDLERPSPPPEWISPQELDHIRYHERVAKMKADIIDTNAMIAELNDKIRDYEPCHDYTLSTEDGREFASIADALDAILPG